MEKTRALSPGEISPEQTVTVLERVDSAEDESYHDSMFGRPSQEHPFTGAPMRVIAVDLPFVAVQLMGGEQKAIIDTRDFRLMEIRADYTRALTGEQPQAPKGDLDRLIQSHKAVVQLVTKHEHILAAVPTGTGKAGYWKTLRHTNPRIATATAIAVIAGLAMFATGLAFYITTGR